jgi:hypothetical protein
LLDGAENVQAGGRRDGFKLLATHLITPKGWNVGRQIKFHTIQPLLSPYRRKGLSGGLTYRSQDPEDYGYSGHAQPRA